MSAVDTVAFAVSGGCAALTAVGAGVVAVWRRGGHSGRLETAIEANTKATGENTAAQVRLAEEFAAHRARTETRLDQAERTLTQHDKRLSDVDRRLGPL